MKKFYVMIIGFAVFIFCIEMTLAPSLEEKNIAIVQSLEFGKQYKFPNSFNLANASTKILNNHMIGISCNNEKIIIIQSDAGTINSIIIREPSIMLYEMKIHKTRWNDPIVENSHFIRKEISPDGKIITVYYHSENNAQNLMYIATFGTNSHKKPPVLSQIEKRHIGDPC